jgi:hypothetical protein
MTTLIKLPKEIVWLVIHLISGHLKDYNAFPAPQDLFMTRVHMDVYAHLINHILVQTIFVSHAMPLNTGTQQLEHAYPVFKIFIMMNRLGLVYAVLLDLSLIKIN